MIILYVPAAASEINSVLVKDGSGVPWVILRLAGAPPVSVLRETGCGVPLESETVTVAVVLPLPAVIESLFGSTETVKSKGGRVTVKV